MISNPNRRTRPWRKLAVVVEVTVPPTNRSTEKDLKYHVESWLPDTLGLPREIHVNHHKAAVRVKTFTPYYRAKKIAEKRGK